MTEVAPLYSRAILMLSSIRFFAAALSISGVFAEDLPLPEGGTNGENSSSNGPPPFRRLDTPPSAILKTTEVVVVGQRITIQKIKPVEVPALPIPPAPNPPGPDFQVSQAQPQAEQMFSQVTATVYDGGKTFVRWQPDGAGQASLAGWSNVNFNHFSRGARFQHGGKDFTLLMLVNNVDTVKTTQAMADRGHIYTPPTIPELPTDHPAFVITEGNAEAPGALAVMEGLHAFYKAEGANLELAYEKREQARQEQATAQQADPPEKKDITLRYWRTGGKSLNPQAQVKP